MKERLPIFVGVLGLCAFLTLALWPSLWPSLAVLQTQESYKRWSGLGVALIIAAQWYLAILRSRGQGKIARDHLGTHELLGAFSPVALLLHSRTLGYAYTVVLGAAFLANAVWGLLTPLKKRLSTVWLPTHITLAIFVTGMMMMHVYTVFAYK